MALVLDAGALVGLERRDRHVVALLKVAEHNGVPVRLPAPVLGQVWRGGGGRQALVARFLAGFDVVPATEVQCREAGVLLARAATVDVVDSLVVVLADPGDEIVTSDPDDTGHLAEAAAKPVVVTAV